jgi:hypothetical protein
MSRQETIKRLLKMRSEKRHLLAARQRGDGDNAGGIRALHFPDSHDGAAFDARGDASVALDILALTDCIALIDADIVGEDIP